MNIVYSCLIWMEVNILSPFDCLIQNTFWTIYSCLNSHKFKIYSSFIGIYFFIVCFIIYLVGNENTLLILFNFFLWYLGKDEGEELLRKVNDAVALLTDYNTRLVCEMEDRKKVFSMLHDFIQSQRDLIDQAEQRLQASYSYYFLYKYYKYLFNIHSSLIKFFLHTLFITLVIKYCTIYKNIIGY